MSDHHKHDDGVCRCQPTAAVQSLDEMEFERGIWTAALYGDMDRLESAIRRGATNDRDNSGYTALHYAARAGHLAICKRLVAAGADVNSITNGGVSPLHRAAMMGRVEIVEYLCEAGARLDVRDSDGQTPLHRAVQGENMETIRIVVSRNSSMKNIRDNKGRLPIDLVPTATDDLKLLLLPD